MFFFKEKEEEGWESALSWVNYLSPFKIPVKQIIKFQNRHSATLVQALLTFSSSWVAYCEPGSSWFIFRFCSEPTVLARQFWEFNIAM